MWVGNYGGFDPGGRLWSIVADPLSSNIVYVSGTDNVGFYASFNGGFTWFPFTLGLWNTCQVALEVNSFGNWRIFYTGLSGDGVYYNYIKIP
jgi:hypothetical protein